MNYLDIIVPFVGGLALFLYGMNVMAQGLQNAADSKMKSILEALTHNKLMGILLGALVTAIVQSSSATTVMVVGFVNAGLMNLTQAIGVIMGANIGTTITSWLVSSSEWAKFLSPETIAPFLVLIGVIVQLSAKKAKNKEVASIIIGIGVLFIGMNMMSDGVSPLKDSEVFRNAFITMGSNPLLGILVGAAVTAIIQSSSASQGILLSLASTGMVPFNAAVFIIMGQNIGTCVTAIISGIGADKNAKCVGYMHLMFNVLGTAMFSVIAMIFFAFSKSGIGASVITMTQISVIHTTFNIGTTLILCSFSDQIIRVAMKMVGVTEIIPESEGELLHLDKRMLQTPSLAVEGCIKECVRVGKIAQENLRVAFESLDTKDPEQISEVKQRERTINKLCEEISEYLVEVCGLAISDRENAIVTSLLGTLADIERVGDHADNVAELAEEAAQGGISFSPTAREELHELMDICYASYSNALLALETAEPEYAAKTVELENMVDDLEKRLRLGHIHRLSNNECNVNAGIHFLEVISNLERVSDHAENIAQVAITNKASKRIADET